MERTAAGAASARPRARLWPPAAACLLALTTSSAGSGGRRSGGMAAPAYAGSAASGLRGRGNHGDLGGPRDRDGGHVRPAGGASWRRAAADRGLAVAEIASADHPALLQLQELLSRRGRRTAGRYFAEGDKFLRMGPRTVFVRRSRLAEDPEGLFDALLDGGEEGEGAASSADPLDWGCAALADSGTWDAAPGVAAVADELFAGASTQEASQGVICVFALPRHDALSWAVGERAVVLDCVQDSINIGGILRTMEAFDAKTLITTQGTTDIYNPKVVRCSMGAIQRAGIQVLHAKSDFVLRKMLRGYRIFATSLDGQVAPSELADKLTGKDAFVFGNEALGVSEEVLKVADHHVRIPMSPQVESLNVMVSAGIVLHAAAYR